MKKVLNFALAMAIMAAVVVVAKPVQAELNIANPIKSHGIETPAETATPAPKFNTIEEQGQYYKVVYDINGEFAFSELTTVVQDNLNRVEYFDSRYERDPKVYADNQAYKNFYTSVRADAGDEIQVQFEDAGHHFKGKLYKGEFLFKQAGKSYFKYFAWLKAQD